MKDNNLIHQRQFGFMENHSELVVKAIKLGTSGHIDSNHRYGDGSYVIHLAHVFDVACRFIHLLPNELRPYVLASCWLHDSIEDARLSYNDIKKVLGVEVAEMVRAVTNNGRGRNRKERMPDYIYKEISDTEGATFLKLCDRIANMEAGGKTNMYVEEHDHFKKMLFDSQYEQMFDFIEFKFIEPRMKIFDGL